MNLSCVVFMHFVMSPAFALWHSDVMLADLELLRRLGSSISDFGLSPRPLGNVVSDVSQTAAGIRMETEAANLSQDRSGTLQGLFHPNSKANPGEGSGLLERATCCTDREGTMVAVFGEDTAHKWCSQRWKQEGADFSTRHFCAETQ